MLGSERVGSHRGKLILALMAVMHTPSMVCSDCCWGLVRARTSCSHFANEAAEVWSLGVTELYWAAGPAVLDFCFPGEGGAVGQ